MEKRQLNIILTKMFPWKNATCVFTHVDFSYLKETGFSLAWRAQKKNIKPQLIIVGSGKSGNNIRGNFFVANILDVKTCEEIKLEYNLHKKLLPEKLLDFIKKEMKIPASTFYEVDYYDALRDEFMMKKGHDDRLIIEFDNDENSFEDGKIQEEFKGLSNPIFHIPKR